MFDVVDVSGGDPGGPPDVTGAGEWHRQVVAVLFEFGLEAAGLLRFPSAWWELEWCGLCWCGHPRGDRCWYCPPAEEEVAA